MLPCITELYTSLMQIAYCVLSPFIWMISISFKSRKHPRHILAKLSLNNFLWGNQSPHYFLLHAPSALASLPCTEAPKPTEINLWCLYNQFSKKHDFVAPLSAHTDPLILTTGHWFQDSPQDWWYEIQLLAHCFSWSNDSPWSWGDLTQIRCWRRMWLLLVGHNKEAAGWHFHSFIHRAEHMLWDWSLLLCL